MPAIAHDWLVLRAEAEIIVALLRASPPPPPEEAARLVERAQELQQLGWAARELLSVTASGRMH